MDGGEKPRVLVVDDEPQILLALEDQLSDQFTVVKSQTPENALRLLESDPQIAVVITDQRMPRMTGDELLARMVDAKAVGIMVSGFADLPAVVRAINDGKVFAYVTKPWNPEDLRFKVAKGVDRFNLARQVARERQLLADLMNSGPDAIYFKGRELEFQRANRAFSELLGARSPESLLGRRLSDGIVQPDLAAEIEREEAELLATQRPILDSARQYVTPEGRLEWYSESKSPIVDQDGAVSGLVAISRNVTERLRTQEALRRSEEQFRHQTRILNSILDGIGEGVLVLDASGKTLLFNSEAERVLGCRPRDVPPERWTQAHELYMTDGRTLVPTTQNPLFLAMHGKQRLEAEVIVRKGQAPGRRVAIVATPHRNDQGEATGAIALLRDVTERRNLEQLLAQSQKMEAVGQLAGGIAHDFNNLLAVIEGNSELALQNLEGHPAHSDVTDILAAAKRAASLTRQLLAFSRRETARPEPINLAYSVHTVAKMLRRLIGEHITLRTELAPVSAVVVDPGQIEQVLVNLCINARDAMPAGGTLAIELSEANDEALDASGAPLVTLRVIDTGTGMSPEVRKRIFEPFFTTKEVGKGTGLGLAMVYGIVTQNGGQISVDSSPGRGSTFTISFPAVASSLPKTRISGPPRPVGQGSGTILIVEDDPAVRSITARILRSDGYSVMLASRPSEARAISEAYASIDLLLTDLVMPEMSGVKLAAELQAARPGLRVLFMTGYAGAALHLDETDLVSPDVPSLQKPFTANALLDMVKTLLLPPASGRRALDPDLD